MSTLRVVLLGRFQVFSAPDEAVPGLEARKVQELLAYLLLHRDRAHYRETLADRLWNDSAGARAKKYLRKALWMLQTALAEVPGLELDTLLAVESEWIRLHGRADVWADFIILEQAFNSVREIPGARLSGDQVQLLHQASQLYQGDLLAGCYEEWCLCERERLQHTYLSVLDKLMRCCEAQGRYEAGIAYGYQILRYERAREHTHREMMRLLYLGGDRTGALRQYDNCVAVLAEELDVAPARRTEALCRQIRQDQQLAARAPASGARGGQSPAAQDLLAQLWEPLEQLQTAVTAVQRHIWHATHPHD